jgi:hypothetical protein
MTGFYDCAGGQSMSGPYGDCTCGGSRCGRGWRDSTYPPPINIEIIEDHQGERMHPDNYSITSGRPSYKNSYTGYDDIDEFLDDCLDTMRKKGHDYRQGNDADLLHNFRTVAETIGRPMEKVWFTYFYKHYSALFTYIKERGQSESEPIENRVKDMIVYLLLFFRMVKEKKQLTPPPEQLPLMAEPLVPYKVELPIDPGSEPAPGSLEPTNVVVQVEAPSMDINGRPTTPGSLGTISVSRDRMMKNLGMLPTDKAVLGDKMTEEELRSLNRLPGNVLETAKHVTEVLNERDRAAPPGGDFMRMMNDLPPVDYEKLAELEQKRRLLEQEGQKFYKENIEPFLDGPDETDDHR